MVVLMEFLYYGRPHKEMSNMRSTDTLPLIGFADEIKINEVATGGSAFKGGFLNKSQYALLG